MSIMDVPLARPDLGADEELAVVEVLRSGWVSEGPAVSSFEQAFADLVGTRHAVALNSCTSALFLALRASKVRGEVLVPSFTWAATANAIVSAGATPVWVDIEGESFGMDPDDARAKLSPRTEAIVCVHFAGHPCGVAELALLAEKHSLLLIEDAAQTLGGRAGGQTAGSFGVGCFSFFATKAITTGDGGMITTDDAELATAVRRSSRHGVDRGRDPWHREAVTEGFNMRMPSVLAALGHAQLQRLDDLNYRRRKAARVLTRYLHPYAESISPPVEKCGFHHVYQMYVGTVARDLPRDEVVLGLRKRGIEASVHFSPPVHRHAWYRPRRLRGAESLPVTDEASRRIVTLPLHPGISDRELQAVRAAMGNVLKELDAR
jgi:dTDP-4-amino-4,6-dideoxygalactose transaminase